MTFRSFTLTTTWILEKEDRYTIQGSKHGTLHEIRTVVVSQTWSADDAPDAEDPTIHTNVHLSGVVRNEATGKKVKGMDVQDNLNHTDDLPQFIREELDDLFRVRNTLWNKSKGRLWFTRRAPESVNA